MLIAPYCENEESRLEALQRYRVLDTEAEAPYDDLVSLASTICDKPISLVSLVDKDRQWFKAKVGLDADETSRDVAFCAHTILQEDIFSVSNALEDERFKDNPLVTEGPKIRFYAGVPLITRDGYPLGTLCVIDREPGNLNPEQQDALKILGRQVVSQLELRLSNRRLEEVNREKDGFIRLLSHDLRSAFGTITGFAKVMKRRAKTLAHNQIEDMAGKVLKGSDQGLSLLESTLAWSLLQGDAKLRNEECVVKNICEEAIEYLEASANEKQISIDIHCTPELQVKTDPALLRSVLQNLIHNAIKFSNNEGHVEVHALEKEEYVKFNVRDNGVGMAENKAKNLFAQQAQSTKGTDGERGTGIGTQLIKEFVHYYKGCIHVESTLGQGTNIAISIPK